MGAVFVTSYAAPPIDRKEILRYAGVRGDAPDLLSFLEDCLDEVGDKLSYKLCYCELPIVRSGKLLDLGFIKTASSALEKALDGCDKLVLFAATVGMELDRLIARYGKLSPARALFLQAIGAERIEALCDAFCRELAAKAEGEGLAPRPRFSPGYGDFPLIAQKEIFAVLDPARRIGLALNESLLMSPSKSVTALVGLAGRSMI